jgi:hypothetical protein
MKTPIRSLRVPMDSLEAPGSADNKPESTSNDSRAEREANISFRNAAGAPGNHSYYF